MLVSCEEKIKNNLDAINGDKLYQEGILLLQKNDLEAYKKFQSAISYYKKYNDYSNISKSLICQAIAQQGRGDIFGAESTLVEALKIMKDDDESLFSVYDTMANLKLDQKEYLQAIKWYDKALLANIPSEESKTSILNNKSVALFKSGDYSDALKLLQQLEITNLSDVKLKNRIKDNIEYVKWLKDKNYPAQKSIERIAQLKLQNSDFWGLNSSYAHLSEINKNHDLQKSLYYAKKMLEIANKNKSPEDRLEAIERIILVDNANNAKKYFSEFKILSDSIQISRNDYRTQFAYIKYDSEKKDAENQSLKLKDAENKINIIYLGSGLMCLTLILIFGYFWNERRKKNIRSEKEQEKLLEVKNTELKYSKKVHDRVANRIYQIISFVENTLHLDKNSILFALENVYETSRDISYENLDVNEKQNYRVQLSNMLSSYSSPDIAKVIITGNDDEIWQNTSLLQKTEVYLVLQELMTNMKKHSRANIVSIKFSRENSNINISYTDNGIGIKQLSPKNGLQNMENRINSINGTIIFDTETNNLLKINISFPV